MPAPVTSDYNFEQIQQLAAGAPEGLQEWLAKYQLAIQIQGWVNGTFTQLGQEMLWAQEEKAKEGK